MARKFRIPVKKLADDYDRFANEAVADNPTAAEVGRLHCAVLEVGAALAERLEALIGAVDHVAKTISLQE